MLQHSPLLLVLLLFVIGSLATWLSGVRLSISTDILAQRYGIGEELAGMIFLSVVVNLPEIAIVAAAALFGNLGLGIGNILGGIAIQTVVLVLLDFVAVHERPLSFAGSTLALVLQAAFLVGMLAITIMGMPVRPIVVLRTTPVGILLIVTWVLGLWVIRRAEHGLPWTEGGIPRDLVAKVRKDISAKEERLRHRAEEEPIWLVWLIFGGASLVTLVGGVVLEESSARLAEVSHLGGIVFGATVLAAVTALPEVSTGLASIRLGDYRLAFSDIFGSNAFLPVLLPLITLLSGRDPLPIAGGANLYLSALGILVTVIYLAGLVFRPQRQFLRLGPDSWSVLIIYLLGIAGLAFVR